MKRGVGPKPSNRFSHHGAPVSSGCALTVTPFDCRRCESAFVSAKAGISVLNFDVVCELLYDCGCLKVPWMAVPFEVIPSTFPWFTCCRKYGLYGMRTRDGACVAREPR